MNNNEFISTYSDDMIYLNEMKDSYLTHPTKKPIEPLFIASFTRIFCVYAIGNIEAMITAWNNAYKLDFLESYLTSRISNKEKISNLAQAFKEKGVEVDEEIIGDFEAIKYLRNTIIHSNWNSTSVQFIKDRNFPTDSRELNKEHLERIEKVNEEMMFYLFLASKFEGNK